ncbi:MAG: hypothetical protein VX730_06375 [Pseudomonadota bacterium]|nr:hypothetical protein [Pseudomonadota bacterium]
MSNKSQAFQARLENQKTQLERHGNMAEVVIRTTPEATDIINAARLWEHVMIQADRRTRGYVAKQSRDAFDDTRKDFDEALGFMMEKLKACVERHEIDLTGNNFVSRIAQRYKLAEKRKQKPKAKPAEAAPVKEEKPVEEAPVAAAESSDGF